MVQLPVPRGMNPIDIGLVLSNFRQNPPATTLVCTSQWCGAFGFQIPSTLRSTPGHLMCLHLLRNQVGVGVGQGKVLTPLQRLLPNQPEWPGMSLKAVLADREQGGRHWIAYLEVQGIWWKVDSGRVQIVQSDPFIDQINPMLGQNGFTMDVLMFGQ